MKHKGREQKRDKRDKRQETRERREKMKEERKDKRQEKRTDDVGSLASFGSRCVTSPCHANAWPRRRFGSRDPG